MIAYDHVHEKIFALLIYILKKKKKNCRPVLYLVCQWYLDSVQHSQEADYVQL